MKKTIFILNFILSTSIFAQSTESLDLNEKEYYDLMTYVPNSFEYDSIYRPKSELLLTELNTIGNLRLHSSFRNEFKLSNNDIEWLEKRIDHLASSLFWDGKRILISQVNVAFNSSIKMIDAIKLNDIRITELKFLHSCTNAHRDKEFIRIFNDRMYALMKIKPPDYKTQSFYGKYEGKDKGKLNLKLVLVDDRTFKFWINGDQRLEFAEGLWKNKKDILVLNSKTLSNSIRLGNTLSNAKMLEYKDLEFSLKKGKLKALKGKKRKLKKIE